MKKSFFILFIICIFTCNKISANDTIKIDINNVEKTFSKTIISNSGKKSVKNYAIVNSKICYINKSDMDLLNLYKDNNLNPTIFLIRKKSGIDKIIVK